jgi:hypothetical protein
MWKIRGCGAAGRGGTSTDAGSDLCSGSIVDDLLHPADQIRLRNKGRDRDED